MPIWNIFVLGSTHLCLRLEGELYEIEFISELSIRRNFKNIRAGSLSFLESKGSHYTSLDRVDR